jgi:hypothetical protein
MAQVDMVQILQALQTQLGKAMERAVNEGRQAARVSPHDLYREFMRATIIECPGFQTVPDQAVNVTARK